MMNKKVSGKKEQGSLHLQIDRLFEVEKRKEIEHNRTFHRSGENF